MSLLEDLPEAAPFSSGGITLNLRRLGRGRRLVLLHGGPGLDHHVLLPLAVPLASHFEVWLPDLPGHGRSHEDSAGLPDLTALLERATRWIESSTQPDTVLLGHSLGAWLLREMLARGRIRPSAAILMSSPVPSPASARRELPRSWIGARRARQRGREAGLAREFLELCAEESGASPPAFFVEAVSRAKLRPPARYDALLGQVRRVQGMPLRTIDPGCPVLVLAGAADAVCPPQEAQRLAAATAGARVRILEGAGHWPFLEDPAAVTRAILRFVEPD